jgi:Raf kinase inhibitor-like YbhB/YbcL family protein
MRIIELAVLLGIAGGAASLIAAEPPQGGGAQPGPPPAQSRRAAVATMTLTPAAWNDGGMIPARHTQAGGEVSPPLSWDNVPADAASFVLIVHDADAAVGSGTDDVLHWMVWNIPKSARALPEGVPQGPQLPDGSRQISATGPNYRGPGAPASGPAHHYLFEIYALDTAVNVPAVGQSPADTRAAVMAVMAGHVRGKGVLVGLYRRPGA